MIRLDVNIADQELIEYEKRYISKYNPKFNFTEGGDGFGSGENNPNFGKLGKDNPFYKEYARVIKGGFKNNKPTYNLEYDGKTYKTSIDKEKLLDLAKKINDGEDISTVLKKPIAVINKEGKYKDVQKYAIVYNKKRIKISSDLYLLEKIVDDINDGVEIKKALNNYRSPPKIGKAGKTKNGEQYYALLYEGKRLKRSKNIKFLQSLIDSGEYLEIYDKKYGD